MGGQFTQTQIDTLLKPIKSGRVYHTDGHANLAGWDVAAHMNRMFGFGGWEKEILALDLICEKRGTDLGLVDKKNWYVTYRCMLRLRVRSQGELVCEIDDVATGTAQNQPSLADAHDLACKNAVTYALKRCAKDLGDQFGLSLYKGGTSDAVVIATLVTDADMGPMPPGPKVEQVDVPVDGEGYAPGEEPFE